MAMEKAQDVAVVEVRSSLDEAWQAFLDRAAGPGDRYDQIRALGGMARARERWRREDRTEVES